MSQQQDQITEPFMRYELRTGKYGMFVWDTQGTGYAVPLESIIEKLNRKETYKQRLAKANKSRPMPHLKPCPFCGGRADQPEFYGESKTARFIICGTCGANVYRALPGEADTILIAAWNARASSDSQPWSGMITHVPSYDDKI